MSTYRAASGAGIRAGCLAVSVALLAAGATRPGIINCVEGRALLDGKPAAVDGSGNLAIGPGRLLETEKGRVEVLLTPGVFLRVAEGSAVRMAGAPADQVRLELLRGEILIEAAVTDRRHPLEVLDHGTEARIVRGGVYEFHASGTGGGRAVPLHPRGDDADPLYRWSLQRAAQDASVAGWTAETMLALGEDGARYREDWYWNPWFGSWAFVPGKPYRVTPFGFGYYAPGAMHSTGPVFDDFQR